METKEMPCMVCKDPVQVAVDIPDDEPVLCMVHWFTEDVTEEWEAGDGTNDED